MTLSQSAAFRRLWEGGKPLIGMVHLAGLPGAPHWGGEMGQVLEAAVADARALESAGFDGVLVENFGDVPFFADRVPAETVAAMTRAVDAVVDALGLPVGVNVLRNDARAALGIAVATRARFIRVNVHTGVMWTDQGTIEGRAADTLRARAALGQNVSILADVLVKHAASPVRVRPAEAAEDAYHRGMADALLVSGSGTGKATDPRRLRAVKDAVPEAPVLVASGVTAHTARELLEIADGLIVGTALMRGGRAGTGVDQARARAIVEAARA